MRKPWMFLTLFAVVMTGFGITKAAAQVTLEPDVNLGGTP